jgi:hypothetical protein
MTVEPHEDQRIDDPLGGIEGAYRTWTMTWNNTFGGALNIEAAFIDNRGVLYIYYDLGTRVRAYDLTGANIYNPGGGTELMRTVTFYKSWSALERYHIVWQNFPGGSFYVVEHGVQVFARNPALDVAAVNLVEGVAISPDGHYIAAVCEDTVSGLDKIIIVYTGA